MSKETAPLPSASALRVEAERVHLLYQQNVPGMAAFFVYSSAYVLMSWSELPQVFLISWYVFMSSSVIARAVATVRWKRQRHLPKSAQELGRWLLFLKCMLFLSGIGWGALGWTMTMSSSPHHLILTTITLFFMAVGAMVCYSSSLAAMNLVVLPALLPWALSFLISDVQGHFPLGMLALLYVLLAVRVGTNLHSYVNKFLRLSVENSLLTSDLRAALESSGAFTWMWNPSTDEFVCEGPLDMTLGLKESRLAGTRQDYLRFVAPEDRSMFVETLDQAATDEKIDFEHRVIWPDGSVHWASMSGRLEGARDGQISHVTGICRDVTEKKSRDQLRKEVEIHEAANRAKSLFLANASHEIRTPLAAINGFTEMILENPKVPLELKGDIQIVLRNGRYLVSLVNDLLDLSKIENGRLYVQRFPIFLKQEIADAVAVVKTAIDQKRLGFELEFLTSLPDKIQADPTRFRQILINLLSNAVKFTENGEIRMRVSYWPTPPGAGRLSIRISDSGVGLNAEARANLFQPFMRGSGEALQGVPGSGLGLALSRNLARLMGGDIRLISSEFGKGSEFELSLAVEATDSDVRTPPKPPPVPSLSGARVLLVEDTPDLRTLMTQFLNGQGSVVDVAQTSEEALKKFREAAYDIILMDIKLPDVDGFETTRQLRAQGYDRPIIALTAHASLDDRQRSLRAGCTDYLSKPVEIHLLSEMLSAHLKKGSLDASL